MRRLDAHGDPARQGNDLSGIAFGSSSRTDSKFTEGTFQLVPLTPRPSTWVLLRILPGVCLPFPCFHRIGLASRFMQKLCSGDLRWRATARFRFPLNLRPNPEAYGHLASVRNAPGLRFSSVPALVGKNSCMHRPKPLMEANLRCTAPAHAPYVFPSPC